MTRDACLDANREVDAHSESTAFQPAWVEKSTSAKRVTAAKRFDEEKKQSPFDASAGHLKIKCSLCGAAIKDDGLRLECNVPHGPSLLVSDYGAKEFKIAHEEEGLYRYRHWLPVRRILRGAGRTVTYRSEKLSKITGLKNLWIAFNGYWPEKGAALQTCTFKELEAYAVSSRLPLNPERVLVVASAGNTAAAFARVCSLNHTPCLLVVPESGLDEMWFDVPISSCVKLVSLGRGCDYSDAIQLAEAVARQPGFVLEGGAKNVARRDGLGTVLLNAFEAIGDMPDFYFQAIGSGAGAIAAHEAARRLTEGHGPFPRLWLSQNEPFVPICSAWRKGLRSWTQLDEAQAKSQIAALGAKALSNRFPPYSVPGGLYDALVESDGNVVSVTNRQASVASALFEAVEGIDLHPAAAVGFASLLEASRNGLLAPDSTIVLNLSGGGKRRLASDAALFPKIPDLTIDVSDVAVQDQIDRIGALFNSRSLH